jgi:hypothetical protein
LYFEDLLVTLQRFNCPNNHNIMTKNQLILLVFSISILFNSCKPNVEQEANQLLTEAQTLVDNGSWRQALIILDSLHNTYPRLVTQRRIAKNIADSITYLEAQATLAYTDTLLPPLLLQADELLKHFKYEKNNSYEDAGRYVHKLLITSNNTDRNFIQAYVRDDRQTIVKSYYFGPSQVNQNSVILKANEEEQKFSGNNHHFLSEGHHEIMTLENEQALAFLNFVSTHHSHRIAVEGKGQNNKSWVYYLNTQEKDALSKTYQLGWVMKDIKHIEQLQKTANAQIMYYQQKKAK